MRERCPPDGQRVSLDGTKRKVRQRHPVDADAQPARSHPGARPQCPLFTPRRVEKLRPEVEQMCDLLDDLGGEGDFVGSVAFLLPANVISALVGVPAEDRDTRPLIYDLTVGIEQTASPEDLAAAEVSGAKLTEYLRTSSLVDGPSRRTISSARSRPPTGRTPPNPRCSSTPR